MQRITLACSCTVNITSYHNIKSYAVLHCTNHKHMYSSTKSNSQMAKEILAMRLKK